MRLRAQPPAAPPSWSSGIPRSWRRTRSWSPRSRSLTRRSSLDLIHIPDQGDYRQRLALDFAAGTPADVVLLNYRSYGQFAAQGALEPLGPYLDASEVIQPADFYAQALDPFHWKGVLTCIPQNLSSLVVYYDKALFDAAGLAYPADDWTWDEFLATAQALTKDIDGDGQTDQFGLGTEASILRLAPFIWQNGGELVVLNDKGAPVRLALDSPAAKEAFQWFVDLQVEHHVVPNAEEEAAEDSESRFQNGRTAMYLNSRRTDAHVPRDAPASTGTSRRCRGGGACRRAAFRRLLHDRRGQPTRTPRGHSSSSPTRPRGRRSSPGPDGPCHPSSM